MTTQEKNTIKNAKVGDIITIDGSRQVVVSVNNSQVGTIEVTENGFMYDLTNLDQYND